MTYIKPSQTEIAGAIMGQPTPEDAAAAVETLLPGRTEKQHREELAREVKDLALDLFERNGQGDPRAQTLWDVVDWLTTGQWPVQGRQSTPARSA